MYFIWQVEMLKDSLPLAEELHLMGNKLREIAVCFPLLELFAAESQISMLLSTSSINSSLLKIDNCVMTLNFHLLCIFCALALTSCLDGC